MTDEIKLHATVTRGNRAKLLLEDELLKEAFKTLEDQYVAAWAGSEGRDTTGRELMFQYVQVLRRFRDHLAMALADGKLAAAELNRLTKNAERKRFGIL